MRIRHFWRYFVPLFACGVIFAGKRLKLETQRERWSERGDLNSRPPVPQTGALTELRYAPTAKAKA